mmetsp:Transcript_8095/g.9284  ORF Transcript_8095/g.9284 Transcript_8095/m.9284 type:complete len:294 (+) Transcript_8095:366-1247(+)|eukprot:CAMPEP_0184013366 /NCGR_PEP_ID=MMETSP0954-20121128/4972_1 /TAXON_ID=627963 /ORGANISM="Aplanochytrium sp, Strain PBS07" /LENGTH=293 /DNA_ID=CAMNT_0026293545 /DNA_START=213 /DNA_END=1094 /DNA_ORIENTATION=-
MVLQLLEKFLYFVNALIFIFSVVIVGIASATIYNYDETADNFYSKSSWLYILFAGLMGILLALFACSGIKNQQRHYNRIFIYFVGLTVIVIIAMFGFAFYHSFIGAVEGAGGDLASGADALQREIAEEVNDYILSAYTECCTGCDQGVQPECTENVSPRTDPDNANITYCETPGLELGVGGATCAYAPLCNVTAGGTSQLGEGCYINSVIIPSYTISGNECAGFEFIEIVGPKPLCGNGSPKTFLTATKDYLVENKTAIYTGWGFTVVVLLLAWLGTFKILLCPHYEDKGSMI